MSKSYLGFPSFGRILRFVSVVYIKYTPSTATQNPLRNTGPSY